MPNQKFKKNSQILFVSLFLTGITIIAASVFLEITLKGLFEERALKNLQNNVDLIRSSLKLNLDKNPDLKSLNNILKKFALDSESRLTIIQPDGVVSFDNMFEDNKLESLDNHGNRPEVLAIVKGESFGKSIRYSKTLKRSLIYLAAPFEHKDYRFYIRLSKGMAESEAFIFKIRLFMIFVLILGTFLALAISYSVKLDWRRSLKEIVTNTEQLLADQSQTDLPESASGELDALNLSLNKLTSLLNSKIAELYEQRDMFSEIINSMKEGLVYVSKDNLVQVYNEAFLQHFGISEEPLGKALLDLLDIKELSRLVNCPEDQQWAEAEFSFSRGGQDLNFMVWSNKTSDLSGNKVIIFHDITKINRLENIRRDFISNVSHELRTPVSIILANCETILDHEGITKKQRDIFIDAIHRNSQRLKSIIKDLLDLSRIESGNYNFDLTELSLASQVNSAVKALEQKSEEKGIELSLDIAAEDIVFVDELSLQQIITNLIDNAINYTQEKGLVRVYSKDVGNYIEICVEDNGPGVPLKYHERLFERFFRVDKGRSRHMGGTGLGLSIVRNLCESMNGAIAIDSNYTDGARFIVRLPKA